MVEDRSDRVWVWIDDPDEFRVSGDEARELFTSIEDALQGTKVDWWEVGGNGAVYETINIIVGTVASSIAIVTPVVLWLRKRFRKSPGRGKRAVIYAPDGFTILKEIILEEEDGEPEIQVNKYARTDDP